MIPVTMAEWLALESGIVRGFVLAPVALVLVGAVYTVALFAFGAA